LHGVFALYPIAFFPEILYAISPTGIVLFAIVAGMILYAVPVDSLIPSYKKYYIKGLNDHLISILGLRGFKDVRSLYDVFFYEKLSEVIRYRIHWLVSLYYFYSRTCLVSLVQGTIFSLTFFLTLTPHPPSSAGIIPGVSNPDLFARSILILSLSYGIAIVAFRQSGRGIREVASLEMALVNYHNDDIREIAKISGYLNGDVSTTSHKTS
jgi:hypothetical protein